MTDLNSPPGRGKGWVLEADATAKLATHPQPLPGGEFTTPPRKNPSLSEEQEWDSPHRRGQGWVSYDQDFLTDLDDAPAEEAEQIEEQIMDNATAALTMAENAQIIVMDEPTSSLTDKETDILFGIMRTLKEQGVSPFQRLKPLAVSPCPFRATPVGLKSNKVELLRTGSFKGVVMSLRLTRHHENEMYRETPVSRLSRMREVGASRYIFIGDVMS